MKRIIISLYFVIVALSTGFSQDSANSGGAAAAAVSSTNFSTQDNAMSEGQMFEIAGGRVALAQSSPDYPVTPGDVYILSFVTGAGPVIQNLIVDMGYGVSLGNIGKLSAKGMAFPEFQRLVEKTVLEAYPLSSPILVIQSVGTVQVFLKGEVKSAGIQYVWGYTRLAELWGKANTAYASNRAILVRYRDGGSRTFDLFRYWRSGDLDQNPLIKQGDTVEFSKAERIVGISGQIKRPGQYQLLTGERLRDLIEVYGGGFTPKANTSKLHLTRFSGTENSLGAKSKLDFLATPDFPLENLDSVNVISMQELLPVVYFEGALGVGVDGQDPQAATKFVYTFYPGERLSQAVQALRGRFSAVSDLPNAYMLRAGGKTNIDLSDLIYNKDYSNDIELAANDTVIVPFRQFFVSVAGAVKTPGRYPYIPDRSWEYYVNLAGGVDTDKNDGNILAITGVDGKPYGKDRQIQPEDTIVVKANSFLYGFGRVSAIISTILSTASLIISLIMIMRG